MWGGTNRARNSKVSAVLTICPVHKKDSREREFLSFFNRCFWELNHDVVKVAKLRSTARGHARTLDGTVKPPRQDLKPSSRKLEGSVLI